MLHLGGGGVISHLSCRDDQSRIPSWRAAGMAGSTAGTADGDDRDDRHLRLHLTPALQASQEFKASRRDDDALSR